MAFNSTIKTKYGICPDCDNGIAVPVTAGRCYSHYKQYRQKISTDKLKSRLIKSGFHSEKQEDKELEMWFLQRTNELSLRPVCWECGEKIPRAFLKAAVAHIFPKAQFFSVRTAPLNYIFLGAGCGCHNRTHRLDTFSEMKCFPLAIQRFKTFESQIKETHKYLDLFKSYIA
jgi:RNA polymerase-binding transcription factor DksA